MGTKRESLPGLVIGRADSASQEIVIKAAERPDWLFVLVHFVAAVVAVAVFDAGEKEYV